MPMPLAWAIGVFAMMLLYAAVKVIAYMSFTSEGNFCYFWLKLKEVLVSVSVVLCFHFFRKTISLIAQKESVPCLVHFLGLVYARKGDGTL